ncbi:unnamed protein product, partial [Pylaiella littoralis]
VLPRDACAQPGLSRGRKGSRVLWSRQPVQGWEVHERSSWRFRRQGQCRRPDRDCSGALQILVLFNQVLGRICSSSRNRRCRYPRRARIMAVLQASYFIQERLCS